MSNPEDMADRPIHVGDLVVYTESQSLAVVTAIKTKPTMYGHEQYNVNIKRLRYNGDAAHSAQAVLYPKKLCVVNEIRDNLPEKFKAGIAEIEWKHSLQKASNGS